jgi:cystathionine gamma-synthase
MGGAVMGSFDAYLLLRGLRTFDLRVTKQSLTAAWLAAAVESKLDSFDVLYPGLLSHPQHHIAKAMCPQGLYGGMVSVVLRVNWLRAHYKKNNKGDVTLSNIVEFCKFVATHSPGYTCATSLGGFETLIEHRYSVECPGEKNPHIPAGLLRISVGLESRMALYDGLKKGVISAMEHFGLDTTLEQPL